MVVRILLGVTLLVTGTIWFFQGIGAIGGYGMSGRAEWSVIGSVLIVLAIGLLLGARRRHEGE
jgi:hypothetical protein